MHLAAVSHGHVLTAFDLLRQIDPTATVNGNQEVARIGGLAFTLALTPTIREDTYDGLTLRTINPAVGVLDTTVMRFRDAHVTIGAVPDGRRLEQIDRYDRYNWGGLGITAPELAQAIRSRIAAFTGTAPAQR